MQAHDLFEILVREHADMLTSFIRSIVRDAAAADDIFQESMLTAWRRLDDYDKSRPFGPWLRGIAARTMLAWRRQRARSLTLCEEDILEHLGARCESVQSQPGDTWDEKLESLRDCLERLPEKYRVVIQQKYIRDVSVDELAVQLKLSSENLKKRLQRGRAKLLECLQRKLRWNDGASSWGTPLESTGL